MIHPLWECYPSSAIVAHLVNQHLQCLGTHSWFCLTGRQQTDKHLWAIKIYQVCLFVDDELEL